MRELFALSFNLQAGLVAIAANLTSGNLGHGIDLHDPQLVNLAVNFLSAAVILRDLGLDGRDGWTGGGDRGFGSPQEGHDRKGEGVNGAAETRLLE